MIELIQAAVVLLLIFAIAGGLVLGVLSILGFFDRGLAMKPHGRKWRGRIGWRISGQDQPGESWCHIESGGYRKRMKA